MIQKIAITLSVDMDVKKEAMIIIQQKLGTSVSGYVNEKFKELIESHKHSPELNTPRRLKKCQR